MRGWISSTLLQTLDNVSCFIQAAMQGRRRAEQVAGPEGTGMGRLDARRGSPPQTRSEPLERLLSSNPQAIGLPQPVPRPGGSASKLLPSPGLLGATASSWWSRVLGDPPRFWALPLFPGVRGSCVCPGHAIHSPDVFCAIEAPSFH